ncbi:tripartite tricarboxylate transporter permease [Pelobacter seleniigenes]|uniref:tripartite tricarboxylate transporter permease n=1 Tax=Pelobacter seleniigenes TaxID=407188 RepID=UPI0004A6F67A|nr:tripartite tricarboxylate transporter permease [Pelobacter seleniigenes]
MEFWTELGHGWQLAFSALNLAMICLGVLLGALLGSMRGLHAIHGVALLLPLTYAFSLPIESTLILLLTVYYAAEFGWQGETASATETPAEQKHLATAQTLSGIGSFFGGMTANIGMILSIILIKQVALRFGPAEYFVLVIFAFASLSIRAGSYPFRTIISTVLGIMMATIGIDSTTGILRFTMNIPQIFDGIEFTTVVVGLFVISKLFELLEASQQPPKPQAKTEHLRLNRVSLLACRWAMLRSAVFGFIIGVLPGGGAILASKLSLKIETTLFASDRDRLRGRLKAVVAKETANSAAVGGAMVPLLALGIPGSGTAAILLGALLLHNITPGPGLFTQHADLIWALVMSMGLGNLLLLGLYWPLARLLQRVREIPDWLFSPVLMVLAFIGVFSINESSLSLLIMLLLGGCAYLLERWHYPLPPLLLGFVLGEVMENALRRALAISGGSLDILYRGPICQTLWLLTFLVILVPLLLSWFFGGRTGAAK